MYSTVLTSFLTTNSKVFNLIPLPLVIWNGMPSMCIQEMIPAFHVYMAMPSKPALLDILLLSVKDPRLPYAFIPYLHPLHSRHYLSTRIFKCKSLPKIVNNLLNLFLNYRFDETLTGL